MSWFTERIQEEKQGARDFETAYNEALDELREIYEHQCNFQLWEDGVYNIVYKNGFSEEYIDDKLLESEFINILRTKVN